MTKKVTGYFLFWCLSILIIAQLGFLMIPVNLLSSTRATFYQSLSNWDGQHFITVAENGYTDNIQYAFFPGYPLAIRILTLPGIDYIQAGIVTSFICSFLTVFFLLKLLRLDFKEDICAKAVFFLFIFPTSFFLLLVYSESLFLFLSVLTFYFARDKKFGKYRYFWAAIFAALASATRLVGVALVASLFIEAYLDKSKKVAKWPLFLAPTGLILYCVFLFVKTGNPLYFLVSEENWERILVLPGVGLWRSLSYILSNAVTPSTVVALLDLFYTSLGLGLALRAFRFLRPSYAVYFLISVLLPVFTPTLGSMQRFLLVIFPIFILISLSSVRVQIMYAFFSIMLLSANIIFYINGLWVS